MKTAMKTRFGILAVLAATLLVLLSCILPVNLGGGEEEAGEGTESTPAAVGEPAEPGEEAVPAEAQADEDDPIDNILELRSVRITLSAEHPDGTVDSQVVEVDGAGNLHATISLPPMPAEFIPEGLDASRTAGGYDMYVVDGTTYQEDPTDPAWLTTPLEADYREDLKNALSGPSGPGLWLDILPEGSVTEDGTESVGGFDCDRYKVNGTVDGKAITGSIWVEPEIFALVKAELHVPAALMAAPDETASGELEVTLDVEVAQVPAVALPAAPAATTAP